jgi:hypothetical protein
MARWKLYFHSMLSVPIHVSILNTRALSMYFHYVFSTMFQYTCQYTGTLSWARTLEHVANMQCSQSWQECAQQKAPPSSHVLSPSAFPIQLLTSSQHRHLLQRAVGTTVAQLLERVCRGERRHTGGTGEPQLAEAAREPS